MITICYRTKYSSKSNPRESARCISNYGEMNPSKCGPVRRGQWISSLVWPVHLKSLLNHVADCKSQSTISLSAEATGESHSNTMWATWSLPEGSKVTPSTLYGMNNALCCSVEELFLWVCEDQSAECAVQDFFHPFTATPEDTDKPVHIYSW